MANRRFQNVQALNREVKLIAGRVSIGSSGAATLADGLGIASVAKDATGVPLRALTVKARILTSRSRA